MNLHDFYALYKKWFDTKEKNQENEKDKEIEEIKDKIKELQEIINEHNEQP